MKELLRSTAAYKILCGDRACGRLSHAYMLYFCDRANLREALKYFALELFGVSEDSRDGRLILSEGLADMKVFPLPEKKLTAEAAASIVEDAALKPVERAVKAYVISDFDTAAPLFQNKLLKALEEPPEGVCFLLGAASLSPVLDTVKSRVKTLEIPPFTEEEIYSALERAGKNPANRAVARACGGVLGVAFNMLGGGWYEEIKAAAEELCGAATAGAAADAATKYADVKFKAELLGEMQRIYFDELTKYTRDENYKGKLSLGTVNYALANINKTFADLKFNANFSVLLYDFAIRVARRNAR